MEENTQPPQLEISDDTLLKWQNIIDIMAGLIGIPAALIMRLVGSDIEVFVSSTSEGNPYKPGDHEHFLGSGLYCETVINNNQKLLIPNALTDDKWKNNPDVKLNMISYLGFPIVLPNKKPFGTICVFR
jgi:GAF domain-containing protein